MSDLFDLKGHRALVTGAGSGLGKQFAKTLAAAGAEVVLAARRHEKLKATATEIDNAGGTAACIDLDVTRSDSIRECFEQAEQEIGLIDIVVNNAGISRDSFAVELSEEDWDAVIDTDLKGVFMVAQAAAQRLIRAEKPGSIINIASILGSRVTKMLVPYNAAKAGVKHMTRSLALEWARYGIRVNSISPGFFRTEINEHAMQAGYEERLNSLIPMKRIGRVEELSGALLLLASDAGSFMTGSDIVVDGGHLCSSL
ncbi:SDR family NAD(P)-dependent oxidoreductase [Lentisalinibacter orientalis]|uniref:SDR family NAD(P)-dependent oxidoreductase n=1 Tax=Lentisalinibacter orientalis TaxID=2992241 RepID=UPI003865FB09